MNHLSERILFHNMTDLYSLDALPMQPHETGVLGANLLEINAVSSLFLLDAVMHTILGATQPSTTPGYVTGFL
jgi:hypothetical protein